MQDFTNFNQPQPTSSDGYYHDPLEAAPAEPAKEEPVKEEPAKEEPAKEEPPILNQDPEAEAEPIHHEEVAEPEAKSDENKLSQELVDYLATTKGLLEQTRKERNNLIVRIDEEEDKITESHKKQNDNPDHFEPIDYTGLNDMRNELYRKNDLIHALIGVIRSLE